jgi:shikimate kinase
MNLFLIGYRGTGKTTVAELLAAGLGWPWFDTDAEIEHRAGKSIAEIFAADGEPAFRDCESSVLAELCAGKRQVLALGGGVIVRNQNRELIKSSGKTIWLSADPATLWWRIAADHSTSARRPNLTAGGGLEEIRRILAERLPLYRQSADWVVDTEDKSPADVAAEILALVRQTVPVDPA